MKIREAIERVDALKHNSISEIQKVLWLSMLDSRVKHIIDTHEGADHVTFTEYNEETDLETELLAEAPFDEMYLRWLEAQIDLAHRENGSYNDSISLFEAAYQAYEKYYNRTHMPLGRKIKYF